MFSEIEVVTMSSELSAERMLKAVLDALPVGLFWKDRNSAILGCNQKFADDSGAARPADLIGKTNFDFYPAEQAEAYRADDLEVITTGRSKLGIEEMMHLPTGENCWVETNKIPLRNEGGEVIGVLGTYRDITERRRAGDERMRFALELAVAKQAATMAMHDALTGLPNRRCLQEALQARLANARPKECTAIVALDLDRFKQINDLYGHAVGDELLRKVAQRLTEQIGPDGFIARVDGDEFILLLTYKTQAALIARLSTLVASFQGSMQLGDHEVSVGANLGVSRTPTDGVDSDLLLRRADMALYRAKEQGRANFEFFTAGMDVLVQERARLEHDLRIAVRNDQIIPYYQPLVRLGTGEIIGYEVLARWQHSKLGFLLPAQFIKPAEDAGLIGELTMNLLRRACNQVLHWPGAPRIAINISPVQLRDAALPQKLLKVLMECEFPPARLEIEITEDALVFDIDAAHAILISLKKLGVRIALDDFGSGYASLKNLLQLPFDDLKIDGSFVQSMNESKDALTIIKAIIQLAKNLSLSVTAEGIESEEQALVLHALGCEQGQGFYFGRPSSGIAQESRQIRLRSRSAEASRARA